MTKLDSYLRIKEAAKYLGVSPNTLRNWGRDDKVPMHRNPINGYRLFKITDLDELLAEISRPTTADSKPTSVNRKPK